MITQTSASNTSVSNTSASHNSQSNFSLPNFLTPGRMTRLLMAQPVLFANYATRALADSTNNETLRSPSSGQALDPDLMNNGTKTPPQGKLDCPCIPLNQTSLATSDQYDASADCLYVNQPNGVFCYPLEYGLEGCQAYDKSLAPYCDQQDEFPGNPDWCSKSFCYVDPNNCKNNEFYPSTYFTDQNLHYSYGVCGDSNTFLNMINDDLQHSFMELVTATEKGVVSTKRSIEEKYDSIEQFSKSPANVAAECNFDNACGAILEGELNKCWDQEVDFNNINVALHPQKINQANPQDLNTLACLTNVIEPAYIGIADAEHDDNNRIAYQYFGDHKTGALVQYPQLELCAKDYDARFRPWYASAVSGPKDVVAVIDTSGSMRGNRLDLARQATKAVINTLTWADRVSLVTFSTGIDDVYSEKLIDGSEANIEKMSQWIDDKFRINGGTNFAAPLTKAYEILGKNKDADDQKTCSQAILFLTDGEDPSFDISDLQPLVDNNPDAVVFTYGLSANAEKGALQDIACLTSGIFHPVRNEETLPKLMSSYYEYYAKLQDTGKISWIQYQDTVTGVDLIAGCSPVFNFDKASQLEPTLVGVNCMDLNTIVDLATLRSCQGNSYDQFIDQVFNEAIQCSAKGGKVENNCELQNIRAKVSSESICMDQKDPSSCDIGPQPNASDFSHLSPDRFQFILLNNCTVNSTCANENKIVEKDSQQDSKGGLSTGALTGIALASITGVIGGVVALYCYKKKSKDMRANPQQQEMAHRPPPPPPAGIGNYPAAEPPRYPLV